MFDYMFTVFEILWSLMCENLNHLHVICHTKWVFIYNTDMVQLSAILEQPY
jgi:hypothetical protein